MIGLNETGNKLKLKKRTTNLIRRIADEIRRGYQPDKIILFGSYAYGQPTEASDIDLFIVKETERPRGERFVEVSKLIFKLGSGVSVEPLVYTPGELRERLSLGDPFVVEILAKGEVLYDRAAEASSRVVSTRGK